MSLFNKFLFLLISSVYTNIFKLYDVTHVDTITRITMSLMNTVLMNPRSLGCDQLFQESDEAYVKRLTEQGFLENIFEKNERRKCNVTTVDGQDIVIERDMPIVKSYFSEAVQNRKYNLATLLFETKEVDINATCVDWNPIDNIPMMIAFSDNQINFISKLLGEEIKNINVQCHDGRTYLHEACTYDYVPLFLIFKLLKKGAKTDIIDDQGQLPIDKCKDADRKAKIKLLFEKFEPTSVSPESPRKRARVDDV